MRVYVQLAEMFGKSFYREHGDKPSPLWVNAINRLTDSQIANALANLGNDNLSFPANLSMFVSAAKRTKPHRHLGAKQLPDLSGTAARENAERAWADMERLAGRKLRPES